MHINELNRKSLGHIGHIRHGHRGCMTEALEKIFYFSVDNGWIKTIMVSDETSTIKPVNLLKEYAQGQCIREDHCAC